MNYLINTLRSKYCIGVFILSLILSYFLIPGRLFYGIYLVLAIVFMILFALTLTCIIRNIKEKIVLAKTYKSSLIGIIAGGIGLAAVQVCGVGAPVCGATIGMGILSTVFPMVFVDILTKYASIILIISIIFQFIALYFMNCFETMECITGDVNGGKTIKEAVNKKVKI